MSESGQTELINGENSTFIKIDERAYRYIRQFSIKNVTDALVELLTNSDDAYGRISSNNSVKKFWIQYHEKYHSLCVIDNASGLRASDMEKCFMQVGSYTSSDDARGFFSRGAKDVSILGDVVFESIKDGYYSKTYITSNAYTGILVSDQAVTDDDRQRLGIPLNGLSVKIQLLQPYYVTNIDQLISDITKRATLRGIFSNNNNIVKFQYYDSNNGLKVEREIRYTFPAGKLLLDLEYDVPNYPGITAKFTIYRANNPIEQPLKETELEFGFLVQSGNSIHEVSTIDNRFRWHPYMNTLYGSLRCDYINELLKKLDKEGISNSNPTTVIDPSRYAGLNREHPFIEAMLRIPKVRLDYVLRQLDRDASRRSVQLNEFNEILQQLEDLGLNIFDNIPSHQSWVETYDSNLIKAIQTDRQSYVNVERNFMLEQNDVVFNTDKKRLSELANNTDGTQAYVYLIDNNNKIIEIPTEITNISSEMSSEEIKQFYNDVLKYIKPEDFSQRPYIYQMTDSGELVKLFIFSQGQLGDITDDELRAVKKENKLLNIQFTKDINMKYRYNISIGNGKIDITISLNDPVVSKYLLAKVVNSDGSVDDENVSFQMTSLENVSNNKSYIFLGEMFIEIFARIIMYGNALTGNVNISSHDPSDLLRLIDSHYENVAAQIQVPVTNIFNSYYMNNSIKLINTFVGAMAQTIPVDPTVFDAVKNNLLNNYTHLF